MRERPLAVDVSVVAPVFGNRGTLAALRERVGHVLDARGARWELVLVNDNCPGGSGEVMDALAAEDPRVRCIHLTERSGQQRALVAGIRASVGHAVVTLDADLQDPPEAIPLLLDRLGEASVVYAGRRGEYQAKHRHVTSAIFKTLLSIVAKTPRDGGAFIAFDRAAADSIARFRTGHPFVPAMASLLGLPVESVPVERDVRAEGTSAYTSLRRMRVGVAALLDALVWRVEGRGPAAAREAHNRAQVDYYGRTEHPSMLPHSTSAKPGATRSAPARSRRRCSSTRRSARRRSSACRTTTSASASWRSSWRRPAPPRTKNFTTLLEPLLIVSIFGMVPLLALAI